MKGDPAVAKYFLSPEVHHKYSVTVKEGKSDVEILVNAN